MKNAINSLMLVLAGGVLAALTSCGGGGSTAIVSPVAPAPGTADLHGQLVQGARAASSAGDSMSGIPVSLIDAASGELVRSGVTDDGGKFEFSAVPSGASMLLKVEFTSGDLDGDGRPDQVDLSFPLSLADQSVTDFLQKIGLADTNADSSPDAVEVETEVGDDHGRHEQSHQQHRHGDGMTVTDSNGNGVIDDSDQSFEDSNGNGLPDGNGGQQLGESEVAGAIETISADSITVSGTTFSITSATELQIGANHHATLDAFTVGMDVKVEGFTSASGELIASEIKDSAAASGSDDQFGDDNGGSGVEAGDDNGGSASEAGDDNGGSGSEAGDDNGGSADVSGDGGGADDNGGNDDVSGDGGGADDNGGNDVNDDNGGQGGDDTSVDDNGGGNGGNDGDDNNGGGGGGDDNGGHGSDG